MRKGKKVIGQPVISYADGRRLDTVKDVLISEKQEAIAALLVDEGGLLSSSRVVPIESVQSFGRDGIIISGADAIVSASADPDVKVILNRNDKLLGKRVMTDTGDLLGSISDMYFQESTGEIVGLEITAGALNDLTRGSSYLPVADIERMGPDVIFVKPDTAAEMQGKPGGLVGMINKAGDSMSDRVVQTQDDILARLAKGPPEETLVGRLSGSDVADDSGSIVVANGQRITREHVAWARETDNMGVLTKAAAAGTALEASNRAGDAIEGAADNLASMWDRFTKRLGEARDAQGRQADFQQTQVRLAQIADAIGRPVTKVILDRNDSVILDFGDIITHQAIQQAYDANMLDTLLASAYRGEVIMSPELLKSGQAASATIEKSTGGAAFVDELEQKVQQKRAADEQERQRKQAEALALAEERERGRTARSRARQTGEQARLREIEEAKGETTMVEPVATGTR